MAVDSTTTPFPRTAPSAGRVLPALHGVSAEVARPLSLRRNFAWTLAGNVVYAACQWGILIALVKSTDASAVGQWGLAMAIAAPVFGFFDFRLRWVMVADVECRESLRDYLGVRLVSVLLALVTIAAIGVVPQLETEALLVIVLIACAKALESCSDIHDAVLQKSERLAWIARAFMVRGVATVAVVAMLVVLTRSVVVGMAGLVGVRAALLLWWDRPAALGVVRDRAALRPRFLPSAIWRIGRHTLPLGFVALISSLGSGIPRYFVKAYHGDQMLGYFSAIGYIQAVGALFVVALTQVAIGRLAREYRGSTRRFLVLLLRLLAFGGGIGLAGFLLALWFGEWFLGLAYGEAYAAHKQVLVWMMIALAAAELQAFVGAGLVAMRRLRTAAMVGVLAVTASCTSAWLLVPRYGPTGGAWAMVAYSWTTFLLGLFCLLWVAAARSDMPPHESRADTAFAEAFG